MKNLEPSIYRQRLIIEGHYKKDVDGGSIKIYLNKLSVLLKMKIFAGPYSWPPDTWTNHKVKLHELNGFVAWTESGCHCYAWRYCKFFTADIYSCKKFNANKVVTFTKKFFRSNDLIYTEI